MTPPNDRPAQGARGERQDRGSRGDRGPRGDRGDRPRGGGGSGGSGGSGGDKRRRMRGKKGGGGDDRPRREDRPREEKPARDEDLSKPLPMKPHLKKRYGIVFFDNHAQARNDAERLATLKEGVDQLNIVIRAEGDMEDPELTRFGKVFAGAAWTLIHERRVADGWYDEPR